MSFNGAGGRRPIIRKRPILGPKSNIKEAIIVTRGDDLSSILDDAKSILAKSLDNLRVRVDAGGSLTQDEIKDFKVLTSALKDIGSETRAHETHIGVVEQLDNMSTEELLELSKSLLTSKDTNSSED